LGYALLRLGERDRQLSKVEDAVAALRSALMERTRERVPLEWAATQNNLGAALEVLGGRERGTSLFKEAAAAYRNALSERTRELAPLAWAATQNNPGVVLWRLGERESQTTSLDGNFGLSKCSQGADARTSAS
jgi:tetratricopeptide (TPR) repeat protein